MTTDILGVQFILRCHNKTSPNGVIYARITVKKRRTEISLKLHAERLAWDQASGCVKDSSAENRSINKTIESVRLKLNECYLQLRIQKKFISGEAIKNLFLGFSEEENTLLGLIDYHNSTMKGALAEGTLKNYFTTRKYIKMFLSKRFKSTDIFLAELNYRFITEFEFFLRNTKPLETSNPLGNNGIMKHIERLKKIGRLGVLMEWIPKHPFERFKLRLQKSERQFLTTAELQVLENCSFKNNTLNRAKDLFIFSCYTGLAYIDLINLTPNNLCLGMDGEYWIKTLRQKTDVAVSVPVLPPALAIIQKYKNDPLVTSKNRLVPMFSNQKVNDFLKLIAKACNIQKYITFHLARHTFATTVTLTNGVPIETVSRMLGHTKLSTTQIYVHILEKKISDDMSCLRQKYKVQHNENVSQLKVIGQ